VGGRGGAREALERAFLRLDAAWHDAEEAAWAARAAAMDPSGADGPAGRAAAFGPGASAPPPPAGAAALAALFLGRHLAVANAGDCRAVLGRADGSHVVLSRDHLASCPDERARAAAAGGAPFLHRPASAGPGEWRLPPAGLQVTRSLGDRDSKRSGLTALPEVVEITLDPSPGGPGGGDVLLVMATDGLWDALSPAEAVGLVLATARDPNLGAKRLGQEAAARGSGDNVAVVVCFLRDEGMSSAERVWTSGGGGDFATQIPAPALPPPGGGNWDTAGKASTRRDPRRGSDEHREFAR